MTREEFEVLAAKGPVVYCERKTLPLLKKLKPLLTEEESAHLSTARGHALDVWEGRGEWDSVMQEIRARLFLGERSK